MAPRFHQAQTYSPHIRRVDARTGTSGWFVACHISFREWSNCDHKHRDFWPSCRVYSWACLVRDCGHHTSRIFSKQLSPELHFPIGPIVCYRSLKFGSRTIYGALVPPITFPIAFLQSGLILHFLNRAQDDKNVSCLSSWRLPSATSVVTLVQSSTHTNP
jgi:hypothetical protein